MVLAGGAAATLSPRPRITGTARAAAASTVNTTTAAYFTVSPGDGADPRDPADVVDSGDADSPDHLARRPAVSAGRAAGGQRRNARADRVGESTDDRPRRAECRG